MAKRVTTKKRTSATPSAKARVSSHASYRSQKKSGNKLMNWIDNPAIKYVATGMATTVLTRFVTKLADKYPEISAFIQENMDTVESKLAEFKNTLTDSNGSADVHQ